MPKTSIALTFRQDLVFAQSDSIDSKESAEWFLRSHACLRQLSEPELGSLLPACPNLPFPTLNRIGAEFMCSGIQIKIVPFLPDTLALELLLKFWLTLLLKSWTEVKT